uniref:Cerebellin 17 n=1 Tax=Cyprinus carpio TaxID=7962 RepID=A0A8C1QZK2_CYPCA
MSKPVCVTFKCFHECFACIRMKVSVALLCCFLLTDGQTEVQDFVANGKNNQPNIWTEVRDIRDMVVELKVKLDMAMKDNAICKNCLKYFPSTEQPKVAFSADLGMRGDLGPQSTEITLTFNNIFTNIGNNYNPATGLFTAPVKGVYYFRFTACGTQIQQSLGASLHKNGQKIVSVGQWRDHNQHRYASNGAVLQLEVGDVVCVKLLPGYTIYDSPDNLSTFSAIYIRYVM